MELLKSSGVQTTPVGDQPELDTVTSIGDQFLYHLIDDHPTNAVVLTSRFPSLRTTRSVLAIFNSLFAGHSQQLLNRPPTPRRWENCSVPLRRAALPCHQGQQTSDEASLV